MPPELCYSSILVTGIGPLLSAIEFELLDQSAEGLRLAVELLRSSGNLINHAPDFP